MARRADRWVSFSSAAEVLGCSRATVRKRVLDKTIPGATWFLKRLRIDKFAFEKWLRTQRLDPTN
jgi:excisionase family DNA binding protein